MSCIYEKPVSKFFDTVESLQNPEKQGRRWNGIAGKLSDVYNDDPHFSTFLAASGIMYGLTKLGVPENIALISLAPVCADTLLHAKDYALPRIKTGIKNVLNENSYAGSGIRPDNP